jgi:glycosyltransferase involved in cell wall biosynthesis
VRFHRGLPRTEIAGHYASATLCVIPSVWTENSPLVVYESLHSGLPVVGSRIGGIPELIGHDCGFTFAPSDPQDLARAVLRFLGLSSAERQRMSMAAHERARAFDRNRHLHSIEQIYAELLRMPRSESSEDSLWPALLPILERIQAQGGIRGPGPLQVLRSLARSLGLPKVLRS